VAPLPGAAPPELVFPEWPDHVPEGADPWEVWPRSPLQPTDAEARPDYDACVFVLQQHLDRTRPPDEVVVAA
jgi:hypothetical protein